MESVRRTNPILANFNGFIFQIFDSKFYFDSYQDLADLEERNLLSHYMSYGLYENRDISALFSNDEYYQINNIRKLDANIAILHYITNIHLDLYNPNVLFNLSYYRRQVSDRGFNAFELINHYQTEGWREGLNPHPLFNTNHYMTINKIDIGDHRDPLSHFLQQGQYKNYSTSVQFNGDWYLAHHPDVASAKLHPVLHYLKYGFREGRIPTLAFKNWDRESLLTAAEGSTIDPLSSMLMDERYDRQKLPFGVSVSEKLGLHEDYRSTIRLSDAPLVSVIIANYNGNHHLEALAKSLDLQSYRNFEVIFVDDGSSDGSVVTAERFAWTIVRNQKRLGFTGSNNAGQSVARGELIALLNNDTFVEREWLESLVTRIQSDREIAAVGSKIRFKERFVNVSLLLPQKFSLKFNLLRDQLHYKKYFIRYGHLNESYQLNSAQFGLHEQRVEFDIPAKDQDYSITFSSANLNESDVKLFLNGNLFPCEIKSGPAGTWVVTVSAEQITSKMLKAFYIVNNAGGMEGQNKIPYDRGFGERDCGQYNAGCDIDYICGCSVLIRRDALEGKRLFIDEMFAYFEDSELSLRLRRSGYRLCYEPSSVVYHHHSATTQEKSTFWRRQVSRNEIMFSYIRNEIDNAQKLDESLSQLNHLMNWYPNSENSTPEELAFAAEIPSIMEEIRAIKKLIDERAVPRAEGVRIGVFNPYWNTLGGGEAHALQIAEHLGQTSLVDLISTSDFDLDFLASYFGIDASRFRKRIVLDINSALTSDYDIFVNSCYASSLKTYAKKSFYVVSFPHQVKNRDFTENYVFLPNSNFTNKWVGNRWGSVDTVVINPMVPSIFTRQNTNHPKQRSILSVGRFTASGHTKNQLEIARAFKSMSDSYPGLNWRLVLIGSVNSFDYLEKIKKEAEGYNIEIMTNAELKTVVDMYNSASIYVHASGIGKSESDEPELQEHFGMAVAQGVCSGCFPVVLNSAGPSEIVTDFGFGETFDSEAGLSGALYRAVKTVERGLGDDFHIAVKKARARYGKEGFSAKLDNALAVSKDTATA